LKQFCRKVFRDAEVYPFGSFPSGLYLPTADMDMAFMSDGYVKGGPAKYSAKGALFRFKAQLMNHRVAWEDEIEVIIGAKVPLVKFIEHRTGLKVDVSFENDSGVTAIATFKEWRDQYPGMPALVTLVKHFLLMRGLNEPVNGGIGGFSVICLVVSMLQMMPEVQSGNLDTRHHLGQLLLHFFDLYGNKFNYQTIAISLNPPRWIPKVSEHSGRLVFCAHKLTVTPYNSIAPSDGVRLQEPQPAFYHRPEQPGQRHLRRFQQYEQYPSSLCECAPGAHQAHGTTRARPEQGWAEHPRGNHGRELLQFRESAQLP
jgi:DNA polymerase sigma